MAKRAARVAAMKLRVRLRRYHVWLGWIVGLPILFWIVSGLIMIVKPIDEVRGRDLLKPLPALALPSNAMLPPIEGLPASKVSLEQQVAGPRWIVAVKDGPARAADPATGRWLPPISPTDAAREVTQRYRGAAKVASVKATAADDPPLDLRQPVATWQVTMTDGTHFYIDRATGQVVATRTRFWRFYDWMWGLHIMDMTTREEPHNAWVATFGIASLLMAVLALVLLPMTIRRRRSSAR